MNILVALFFLHNVVATVVLGTTFMKRKSGVIKNFGIGLLLDAVAFAIWSSAILLQPANLNSYVAIGAAFFLISLVFFARSSVHGRSSSWVLLSTGITILTVGILYYLRSYVYPAAPSISSDGYFFFNLQPIVQVVYLFVLGFVLFPAISRLSNLFSRKYSNLLRYGLIAQVIGGMILITSTEAGIMSESALFVTGLVMGIAYLLLWATFGLSKSPWRTSNISGE